MKSIIVSALVSAVVSAALVQYHLQPKIDTAQREKDEALQKWRDQVTEKADYAREASHVLISRVNTIRDTLGDPRCRPENLKFDLSNGSVGGVSVSAPVDRIFKEFRPCIETDDAWEEKTKTRAADSKFWSLAVKNTTAEFFFFGDANGRRHLRIPNRRGEHRIIVEDKALTHYQWKSETLEKVLGKPVLQSKNPVSSQTLRIKADGFSDYLTVYHVRLYEASYGCVAVRYVSLGDKEPVQMAAEIYMWTAKCSNLSDQLDSRVSSSHPLDRM